ncbi:MAG: hypothetical protein Q7S58_06310 [Candidatus Binatus sp.]|uniref:hypothetical protein n=1 Tax=Candidatus Binatus sp. TaxID=2811406 RepID=UPI002721EF99|nr:hypothetical protein [Candidatus Binatus sp.]MDO8432010.1 hypothetical protein [Candidatus Binatus sp.]
MATALTMNRIALRQLAAAIAIVMMAASLPSIGVIVIAEKSGPSLTMDICHPLQAADQSPTVTLLARSAPRIIGYDDVSRETFLPVVPVLKGKIVVFPDSPPPKLA